jgi:Tol biopolymer transport system component
MTSKTLQFLSFISIFTICLITESCKKNDAPVNSIVGKWKTTGYTYDGKDLYGTLRACETDNIITFTSDQKVIVDEGPTKCDPSDPQTTSGTYLLSNDNKTVTISQDGSSSTVFNIITLNSTTLTIHDPDAKEVTTLTRIY